MFNQLEGVYIMIKKSGKGFSVKSETGKNLGGPYKTKAEADKRLAQVEYFKHQGSSTKTKK